MITSRLTIDQLDRFLQITSWVDSKLPSPIPRNSPSMYKILRVGFTKEQLKNSGASLDRPRIIPNSKQLSIYDFISALMIDVEPKTRELIYLRNFPSRKSYRALKRLYLDCSHEKLRYMYNRALVDICDIANKDLKKYLS
jgi:hypothetical protein